MLVTETVCERGNDYSRDSFTEGRRSRIVECLPHPLTNVDSVALKMA